MLNTAYHFLVLIRFFLQYQLSWDLSDVTAVADSLLFRNILAENTAVFNVNTTGLILLMEGHFMLIYELMWVCCLQPREPRGYVYTPLMVLFNLNSTSAHTTCFSTR